jgi:hypothetical protein
VVIGWGSQVRMGWEASWKARAGKHTSRILLHHGVSFEFTKKNRVRLLLVMERLNCNGDLHDEIHSEEHWCCLRDNGVDTGESVRNHYVTVSLHPPALSRLIHESHSTHVLLTGRWQ